ncbi:hypothetical protein E6B08_04560 [Pseudomonas putida]|uniref:Type IV pilus assembly protein PilX n=1 Tax=Pseudomonas putida TaxID=303 RepID=A0A4D6X7Q6_PSEPU|nr:hypothetical protein [Pseudomonas putida]QCI10721.1 hypothetical protein E6B08_04560 [Pseudomonas putida]
MTRQRGVVLLLALVMSLLLGLLAASALTDAQQEARMTRILGEGLKGFEQAEETLSVAAARLPALLPGVCNGCQPPKHPHRLLGQWHATPSGYFQVQNLGMSTRATHLSDQPATLVRVTAVSRQVENRQVLEAVYALPTAQAQAPQRLLWRQRPRED